MTPPFVLTSPAHLSAGRFSAGGVNRDGEATRTGKRGFHNTQARPACSHCRPYTCLPCRLMAHRVCDRGDCRCPCRTANTQSEKAATQQPTHGAGSH